MWSQLLVVLQLLAHVQAWGRQPRDHTLPGWKGEASVSGDPVVYGKVRGASACSSCGHVLRTDVCAVALATASWACVLLVCTTKHARQCASSLSS